MKTIEAATYKVGDAKITRVTETQLTLPPTVLYADWDEAGLDEYPRWLVLGHPEARREQVILSVHTWVVELGGQTILIDTGIGNNKVRPFNQLFHQLQMPFMERLEAAGVHPEKVNHVLLTHLHTDHVGWNTRLVNERWVPTFLNAKYVFPEEEQAFFATPKGESRRIVFEDSVLPVIEAKQAVTIGTQGGDYLGCFEFHPTPGHSAGHMSISLKSAGEEAIFTGDVAHNPIQIYRPEWVSVFCAEAEQSRVSRRWLFEYAADSGATLFTAHFPETSAGVISRREREEVTRFVRISASAAVGSSCAQARSLQHNAGLNS